jgi:hypothetical protein
MFGFRDIFNLWPVVLAAMVLGLASQPSPVGNVSRYPRPDALAAYAELASPAARAFARRFLARGNQARTYVARLISGDRVRSA